MSLTLHIYPVPSFNTMLNIPIEGKVSPYISLFYRHSNQVQHANTHTSPLNVRGLYDYTDVNSPDETTL